MKLICRLFQNRQSQRSPPKTRSTDCKVNAANNQLVGSSIWRANVRASSWLRGGGFKIVQILWAKRWTSPFAIKLNYDNLRRTMRDRRILVHPCLRSRNRKHDTYRWSSSSFDEKQKKRRMRKRKNHYRSPCRVHFSPTRWIVNV